MVTEPASECRRVSTVRVKKSVLDQQGCLSKHDCCTSWVISPHVHAQSWVSKQLVLSVSVSVSLSSQLQLYRVWGAVYSRRRSHENEKDYLEANKVSYMLLRTSMHDRYS